MKDFTRQHITDIMSGAGGDLVSQFLTLIDLPDEQFNLIYDDLKAKLNSVFKSPSFQEEVIGQLAIIKVDNPAEEMEAAKELIKELQEDDTLSPQKLDIITTIINESIIAIYKLLDIPRERINVKIQKIHPDAIIPQYAHKTDAGADVYAVEDTIIKPHTTQIVKTGIKVAIPVGYEIQVRPRSGLSLKTNLRIANAPGTIDSDYRGEVGIIMENNGNLSATIKKGDKIAQLVISPVPMIEWDEVEELDSTERGEGGFGSTDKK